MVLRGIIAQRRDELKLFRASTRLTGFADQLALSIDEFQQHRVSPDQLRAAAAGVENQGLSLKLHDLAFLLERYSEWQESHGLLDDNAIMAAACAGLIKGEPSEKLAEAIWVDGFADLSSQEAALTAAVGARCGQATVTFCLDQAPSACGAAWLSCWRTVERSYKRCLKEFPALCGDAPEIEVLSSEGVDGRFARNPVLSHMAQHWTDGAPYCLKSGGGSKTTPDAIKDTSSSDLREPAEPGGIESLKRALRFVTCSTPELEVREAAREIIRHARHGGRFREAAVLVRSLPAYHELLRRVFRTYEIPCFIDQRENVSHHPVAELTRSALRTVLFDWNPEDWFAALKSGLLPASDEDIDRLENEALARGWRGEKWRKPELAGDEALAAWFSKLHKNIMPPFEKLRSALVGAGAAISGRDLASAIRQFWSDLCIQERIEDWSQAMIEGPVSGEGHLTVMSQMNGWLDNLELAFSDERLTCREWLPILEAGLSRLTVGLIPPALDQVLIGSIDRSRNAEAKLVIVLGVNETVFPAQAEQSVLLTDNDRALLDRLELIPGATVREQAAKERHLAYLAFTRATDRLVLSCLTHDPEGAPLNPSPFLSQARSIFPDLEAESVSDIDWREAEHAHELVLPALRQAARQGAARESGRAGVQGHASPGVIPGFEGSKAGACFSRVLAAIQSFGTAPEQIVIGQELAGKLYGPVLRTSVSRLEQFAACPFRFFVHSGLDAKERTLFELDARERGSFQHEVLAEFHERLKRENRRWRDVTPETARNMVATIARELAQGYREGLLFQDETTQFATVLVTEALQDFVQTMVEWMRSQYDFDPVEAELGFGDGDTCPAWELELEGGLKLHLQGRIDRVDVHHPAGGKTAPCVVIDYKSSPKKLEQVLVEHGIQLQLLSYLNVIRHMPQIRDRFGVDKLEPAGVFYVSLRGKYPGEKNRTLALAGADEERKNAYRHAGRFNVAFLRLLDTRENETTGDQIPYRLKNDGQPYSNCAEAMSPAAFEELLRQVEFNLRDMGKRIFTGEASVAPYRRNGETPCDHCEYLAICRSDPWTQKYRSLGSKKPQSGS